MRISCLYRGQVVNLLHLLLHYRMTTRPSQRPDENPQLRIYILRLYASHALCRQLYRRNVVYVRVLMAVNIKISLTGCGTEEPAASISSVEVVP
jgi:hypothetical protein